MIDKTRVSIPCQHFHTWDHNSWKVSSEACCQWSDKGQTFSTVSYSFDHTKDKLVLPFHNLLIIHEIGTMDLNLAWS